MATVEDLINILVSSGADIKKDDIDPTETFENMGLDSLDVFNFFTEIDSELGVEVPDDDFEKLLSIEDVKNYLAARN